MGCSLFRYSCSKTFVIPLFLIKNFRYSIIPARKFSSFYYSSIKKIISPLKISTYSVQYSNIGTNLQYLGYADFKASKVIRKYHNWQTSSLNGFPRITELTHLGLDRDDQLGDSMISDYFIAVIHALAPFSIIALAGCYVLLTSRNELFCYNN